MSVCFVHLQVRGVSGGEKKRVTTGEMLVGNQRFMAMDEISTGEQAVMLAGMGHKYGAGRHIARMAGVRECAWQ